MAMLSKVHGWSDNARDHPSISGGTGGTLDVILDGFSGKASMR